MQYYNIYEQDSAIYNNFSFSNLTEENMFSPELSYEKEVQHLPNTFESIFLQNPVEKENQNFDIFQKQNLEQNNKIFIQQNSFQQQQQNNNYVQEQKEESNLDFQFNTFENLNNLNELQPNNKKNSENTTNQKKQLIIKKKISKIKQKNNNNNINKQKKSKENLSFQNNFMKNFCSALFNYLKEIKDDVNRILEKEGINPIHFHRKYMLKKSQELVTSQAKFEQLFMINKKNKLGNSIVAEKKVLRILAYRFIRGEMFTYSYSCKKSRIENKKINVTKQKTSEMFYQNRFKYLEILEEIILKQIE